MAILTAAEHACAEYERWAAEVKRLTDAIGATECPRVAEYHAKVSAWFNEAEAGGDPPPVEGEEPQSHFREAADERFEGWSPEDGYTRRSLPEIAEAVKDCPECFALCDLIAKRRHARKMFGVAKRRVRHAGKILIPTGEEARDG